MGFAKVCLLSKMTDKEIKDAGIKDKFGLWFYLWIQMCW